MLWNNQLAYTFSARLVGLVGAGCQKSRLNLKIPPKSVVFAPLDPQPKSVNVFVHHCKGKIFTNIFYARKFVSNVFGLGSVAY